MQRNYTLLESWRVGLQHETIGKPLGLSVGEKSLDMFECFSPFFWRCTVSACRPVKHASGMVPYMCLSHDRTVVK